LVQLIGTQMGEGGEPLRNFYVGQFDGSPFPILPWGNAPFDCILVAPHAPSRELAESFSSQIIKQSVDWVQTTGPNAEFIHDLIDETAVGDGLQPEVGSGNPMTSWHDDATSPEEIAEVAALCFGAADFVLCLVVGNESDVAQFSSALRARIRGAA